MADRELAGDGRCGDIAPLAYGPRATLGRPLHRPGPVPAAGAAVVHAVRGAADRRGGVVLSLQLERLRPADQLDRLRQLPLRAPDARILARLAQQRADHRGLARDPVAACA